jgi:GNAT superfamily N-acetyltransferase
MLAGAIGIIDSLNLQNVEHRAKCGVPEHGIVRCSNETQSPWIEVAKENSVKFIWLGVWEHNPRAIRFYEKNQFVVFDKHIFMLGDDAQTDLMMRREI